MKRIFLISFASLVLLTGAALAQTAAPVLNPIGPQTVAEGATLVVNVSATDADLTTPILSTSALPSNAVFTDNLDGTGSLTFNPDFTQAGDINVTFYATDAVTPTDVDSELVVITVTNVNQAPVLRQSVRNRLTRAPI